MDRLCLVVPCYNEARRFDTAAFAEALDRHAWLDLLLVNDGSTDGTEDVLATFAQSRSARARVLSLPRNVGKAEAVRQGLLAVLPRGGLCGFWDADLSAGLDEAAGLRDVFAARPHVQWVWGIRLRALGRDVRREALRHYLGRVFATMSSLLLHIDSYDTQCGAKLFRADALLATALSEPFRSRWIFDVELLARADQLLQHAARSLQDVVYEQPLGQWHHRPGSKVKPGDFLKAFSELLVVRSARAAWRRPIAPTGDQVAVRPSSPAMTAP